MIHCTPRRRLEHRCHQNTDTMLHILAERRSLFLRLRTRCFDDEQRRRDTGTGTRGTVQRTTLWRSGTYRCDNGVEVWRRLFQRYEPDVGPRLQNIMTIILQLGVFF